MDSFGKDISLDVLRVCVLYMSRSFSLYTCSVGSLLYTDVQGVVAFICYVLPMSCIHLLCGVPAHCLNLSMELPQGVPCDPYASLLGSCVFHQDCLLIPCGSPLGVLLIVFKHAVTLICISYVFSYGIRIDSLGNPYGIARDSMLAFPYISCRSLTNVYLFGVDKRSVYVIQLEYSLLCFCSQHFPSHGETLRLCCHTKCRVKAFD